MCARQPRTTGRGVWGEMDASSLSSTPGVALRLRFLVCGTGRVTEPPSGLVEGGLGLVRCIVSADTIDPLIIASLGEGALSSLGSERRGRRAHSGFRRLQPGQSRRKRSGPFPQAGPRGGRLPGPVLTWTLAVKRYVHAGRRGPNGRTGSTS